MSSSSSQHKNALNQHCLEIIAEIESKHYVSVEFVVQVLLERYGVTQFEDLFVGTIHDIPSLCLLAELQRKTNAFLQAYFSTRSIISYLDLDYEIARMLHSFSIPSMRSLQVSKTVDTSMVVTVSTDPNEINLDDDPHLTADPIEPTTTIPAVISFTDFGIGPLYLHALVSLYFPVQQYLQTISSSSSSEIFDHFITARDVLSCLAAAETLPLSLTNSNSLSSSTAVAVESYLCEQYEVTSLLEVGIVLSGDMMLEMLMISHVQAARLKLLAEIQKQQLNDFAQREKDIVVSTTTTKRKHQQQQQQQTTESTKPAVAQNEGCTLQLAVCPRSLVTDFVNKCIAGLGDGPYSPSFSKVEDVVRRVVLAQCAGANNSGIHQQADQRDGKATTTAGKGQRKKRRTQSTDGDGASTGTTTFPSAGDPDQHQHQHKDKGHASSTTVGCCRCCCPFVVETLTDYVMLHVGSSKYRGKRFVVSSAADAAAAVAKPNEVEVSVGGVDTDAASMTEASSSAAAAAAAASSSSSSCTADTTATSTTEVSPHSPPSGTPLVAGVPFTNAPVEESMDLSDLGHQHGPEHGHAASSVSTEVKHDQSITAPAPVSVPVNAVVVAASSSSSNQPHPHTTNGSLGGGLTELQQQPLFECKLFSQNNNYHNTDSSSSSSGGGGGLRVITASELKHLAPWSPRSGTADTGWSLDPSDLKAVGRWGEALVYQYLMQQQQQGTRPPPSSLKSATADCSSGSGSGCSSNQGRIRESASSVEWVNEQEESRASYDLILRERMQPTHGRDKASRCLGQGKPGLGGSSSRPTVTTTTYIEVKTTRFDELNVFELSLWEWQFATGNPRVRYHIYRVFNAGDVDKVRIVVVEDVLQMITERRVKLCLAL